jgi:hypothetical protein
MSENKGITLTMLIISIGIALMIAIVANVIIHIRQKKNPESIPRVASWIAKGFAILSIAAAAAMAVLIGTASAHGLYTLDIDIRKAVIGIQKSHVDQSAELAKAIGWTENTAPENPKDSFVLIYRFSCDDCEAIKDEIAAKLNTTGKKWYAISSRSQLGIAYRKFYNISSTPSLVATNADGKTSVAVIFSDETGKVAVNEGAWNLLLRHMGLSIQ